MSEPLVRAAIKTAIEGVTSVGLVYDRPRFINEWDDFINLFSTSGNVKAWTIRISEIGQTGFVTTGNRHTALKRTYTYIINGYLQFDDSASSEITATALAIAVMDGLDQANLFVSNVIVAEPAQTTLATEVFGDVLVHLITITLRVAESV